jgi:hypothetical protein
MKPDPSVEACKAIIQTMQIGSSKDGCNEDWRDRPRHYHITKAIRHATTALMVIMHVVRDDGENHLKLAITRLAMALAIEGDHAE